ncbi:MAG: hypothetical protein ABSA42_03905 [Terracidiphilus sp.]
MGKDEVRSFDRRVAAFLGTPVVIVGGLIWFGKLPMVWLIPTLPLGILGWYFRKRFTSWNESLTVEEALEQDRRPPILYLRPFKADKIRFSSSRQRIFVVVRQLITVLAGLLFRAWFDATANKSRDSRKKSAEEFLVSLLDPLGPVIAIGRPKEKIRPLGAARMYLGDEWKDVVHEYLKQSQLILMFAGTTTHFAWELQKVIQNERFVPTILILPFFRRYRQSDVDQFVGAFEAATGLHLSKDLRKTRAAFIPRASEIVEIHDLSTPDERVLNEMNPFLGPIAQIMELSHPGWTEEYVELARENHKSNRRWLFAGVAMLLLLLLCSFVPCYAIYKVNREAKIADWFFADLSQGTNPCTDAKLARLIPDVNACTAAVIDDAGKGSSFCSDPRFSKVFPDPDSCRDAAVRANAMKREAKIADWFFADLLQGTNPCTDTNLARLIPDASACTAAIIDDAGKGSSLCSDPRFSKVFPDPDLCRDAAVRADARTVSSDKK